MTIREYIISMIHRIKIEFDKAIGDKSKLLTNDRKSLVDAINEVFTSVDNGKNTIASAVSDKGIATSKDDSFAIIADNIRSLVISSTDSDIFENKVIKYLIDANDNITDITSMSTDELVISICNNISMKKKIEDSLTYDSSFLELVITDTATIEIV